jgi:hypothetical protein
VSDDPAAATARQATVEVGLAHDRLEAALWVRQLEDIGIDATLEKRGGWIRGLLFLGQIPVSVRVPAAEAARAVDYLKKHRFIE